MQQFQTGLKSAVIYIRKHVCKQLKPNHDFYSHMPKREKKKKKKKERKKKLGKITKKKKKKEKEKKKKRTTNILKNRTILYKSLVLVEGCANSCTDRGLDCRSNMLVLGCTSDSFLHSLVDSLARSTVVSVDLHKELLLLNNSIWSAKKSTFKNLLHLSRPNHFYACCRNEVHRTVSGTYGHSRDRAICPTVPFWRVSLERFHCNLYSSNRPLTVDFVLTTTTL